MKRHSNCSRRSNLWCYIFLPHPPQFDEQKDQVAVEQILRVVFLDPERSTPVSTIWRLWLLLYFCNVLAVNMHDNVTYICRGCLFMRFNCFVLLKALEKLKRQLAEAEAALEARKKPPEDAGPRIVGEGLVIDEWVSLSSFNFLWKFSCKLQLILDTSSIVLSERAEGKIPCSTAGWRGRLGIVLFMVLPSKIWTENLYNLLFNHHFQRR